MPYVGTVDGGNRDRGRRRERNALGIPVPVPVPTRSRPDHNFPTRPDRAYPWFFFRGRLKFGDSSEEAAFFRRGFPSVAHVTNN